MIMDDKVIKPGMHKKRSFWMVGFVAVLFLILLIAFYTFYFCNITLYSAFILVVTFYTLTTMVVSLLFKKRDTPLNNDYRPFISIIIPAKNEEKVIEQTVRSLFRIDYHLDGKPHYEIVVVNDDSSDRTEEILNSLRDEYPTLLPVKRIGGRKGKSAVLNYALHFIKGDIVAVFDADSIVEPDFFAKTIPHFTDESVVAVQGRVKIFNASENWLTRFQDDEFAFFHMLQLSKSIYGGIIQLSGNGQLTRRSALIATGGWNEISLTDDQDLTLQFVIKSQFVRYAPDAVVWQEAVSTLKAFLRQRVRWSEGMLRCIFDYLYPVIFYSKLSLFHKNDALSGVMRMVSTIIIWIGHAQFIAAYFGGVVFTSDYIVDIISKYMFLPFFFLVMAGGMLKFTGNKGLKALLRVPFYWIYNIFWLLVAPVGFINAIRNRNSVEWDKTEHAGEVTLLNS